MSARQLLVDTYADIGRSAPDTGVAIIETRGYHWPEDGGGGKYIGTTSPTVLERAFTANGKTLELWSPKPDALQFGLRELTGPVGHKDGENYAVMTGVDGTDAINHMLRYCEERQCANATIGATRGTKLAFLIGGALRYVTHSLSIDFANSDIFHGGPLRNGVGSGIFTIRPNDNGQTITKVRLSNGNIIGLATREREKYPGAAVALLAGKEHLIGRIVLDQMHVSKDNSSPYGQFMFGLYADGGASSVPGIRTVDAYSCTWHGVRGARPDNPHGTGWAIFLRSASARFIGGYTAGAGGDHAGVYITGSPTNLSEGIDFVATGIGGPLRMDNARLCKIDVSAIESADVDATAIDSEIRYRKLGYPNGGGTIINRSKSVNIYERGVLVSGPGV